jgi:ClpP class serine protease
VYSLLVDDVARFRGVSSDAVLEHMADGRVFRGQQAIDAGLVDGVSTLDDLIEQMATKPEDFATRRKARVAASSRRSKSDGAGAALDVQPPATLQGNSDMEIKDVTAQDLQKDNAPLYAALLAQGAQGERERVTAVRATLVAGHEKLVQQMVDDGKTTGAEAAVRMLGAVQAAHKNAADAHLADGSTAARGALASDDKPLSKDEQLAKVQAWQQTDAGKGQDIVAGMKALGFSK